MLISKRTQPASSLFLSLFIFMATFYIVFGSLQQVCATTTSYTTSIDCVIPVFNYSSIDAVPYKYNYTDRSAHSAYLVTYQRTTDPTSGLNKFIISSYYQTRDPGGRFNSGTSWTPVWITLYAYKYSGNYWSSTNGIGLSSFFIDAIFPAEMVFGESSLPPGGCPDCSQQYNDLVIQCGGEEEIIKWNILTCEGECKSCEQDQEVIDACGGTQYIKRWDDGTCVCIEKNLGSCQ